MGHFGLWALLTIMIYFGLRSRQQTVAKILIISTAWYVMLLLLGNSMLFSATVAILFGVTLVVCSYLYTEVQPTVAKVVMAGLVILLFASGGMVDHLGQLLFASHEASGLIVWLILSVPVPLALAGVVVHVRDPVGI